MARKKSNKYIGVYFQELKNGDKSYYITYKENKKDVWIKIGLHSEGVRENLCHQKRNEIISKIRLGEDLPHVATRKDNKTLIELAEKFYEYKEMHNKQNKKTRSRVLKRLNTHFIGKKAMKNVVKSDIEDLQIVLQKDLMPATVNFIVEQIGSIYNWAISNEVVEKNPCKGIKKLKVNNERLRYLEIDEI